MKVRVREEYYRWIKTYEQRRDAIKKRFGYDKGTPPEGYGKAVKNISYRLKYWRRQLRRFDEKMTNVRKLANDVKRVTGCSVHLSNHSKNPDVKVATYLFYTAGLDSGINGVLLRRYTGAKCKDTARLARKRFKNGLNNNIQYRQTWQRWKIFIREQKGVSQAA